MSSYNHDLTGKILGYGRYKLNRCIKRSKMSSVYQGIDLMLQRPVAVKVMNDNLDSDFLLRFQREAHVLAQLDHANIISIYDYGEQDGLVYLVMPYLPTGSLQDDLERCGFFSLQETCTYINQIADALDYAHALKVIHRDLKPSNFLFHPDGRLLLADFGIARIKHADGRTVWSTITDKGTPIGTLGYMAPETIRGKHIDLRADIYALGIVLYQMLSGDVPFKGDTYAILIQQLQGVLPSLHQLDLSIPLAVDAVIQKATALEPEMRYTSAGAFAQALQEATITRTLSNSYATVINQRYTSEPLPNEVFPRTQKTFTVLQEQSAPASMLDTPVKLTAMHLNETHLVQQKVHAPRFSIAMILIILFIISGLLLPFSMKGLLQKSSSIVVVPSVTPVLTSTPAPKQQAIDAIIHYYDSWNKRGYTEAYSQLGLSYQKTHPYSMLLKSYENTLHSSVTINGVTSLSNGAFKVMVTDFAVEKNFSGMQTVNKVYQGYFIVKKENSSLKLTPFFNY